MCYTDTGEDSKKSWDSPNCNSTTMWAKSYIISQVPSLLVLSKHPSLLVAQHFWYSPLMMRHEFIAFELLLPDLYGRKDIFVVIPRLVLDDPFYKWISICPPNLLTFLVCKTVSFGLLRAMDIVRDCRLETIWWRPFLGFLSRVQRSVII